MWPIGFYFVEIVQNQWPTVVDGQLFPLVAWGWCVHIIGSLSILSLQKNKSSLYSTMADEEYEAQAENEVYQGEWPFYLERIGRVYFMLNAYNSNNTIFDYESTPDARREIILWTKNNVKQYIVALRLGIGLFLTRDGRLIADNYEYDHHEFEGDDVASAIQPVRWSREPSLFICSQSQSKVFAQVVSWTLWRSICNHHVWIDRQWEWEVDSRWWTSFS